MLSLAILASAGLMALGPASPAQADPGCQPGGVYRLWVRGSGQNLGALEAQAFRSHVEVAIHNLMPGVPTAWAELGNLDGDRNDGDRPNDPGEYPATAVDWTTPFNRGPYDGSVTIGTDELVRHLNDRYAGDGPNNNGSCQNETVVLGGYSQGADVIGWALERNGGGGYVTLSETAKNHIGFVALYGDPKMNALDCPAAAWVRPSSQCGFEGILDKRNPYLPTNFHSRTGSWCDPGDGVCHKWQALPGNHTSAYRDYWIWQSAATIANAAKLKVQSLNQPPEISVGGMTFLGTDTLASGRYMKPNQYILSVDGRFVFTLPGDGNLVLYGQGFKPIWQSGTAGRSVDSLIMQGDGNLVLYGTGTQGAIWQSGTVGQGTVSLTMQEDGNLVLYRTGGVAVWNTQTGRGATGGTYDSTDHLAAGQWLRPMHYLRSTDRRYVLFMQGDGNLVLWAPGQRILWHSGTPGHAAIDGLVMQHDGNLVIYAGGAMWANNRAGTGISTLIVQGDGNLVTYSSSGATWWTGTGGRV